jgi:leucine dehydrogenase
MGVFSSNDFSNHEQVVFAHDVATGLRAIIAIHSTALGPSLGGCRMWSYTSEAEAVQDVLRLSKGMSYKSALAGLPLGGGKSVIIGDSRKDKTPALIEAMGKAVERLNGRYVVAEDVGTSTADMASIAKHTRHVAGLAAEAGGSGDPSPFTALGVFNGLKQAVKYQLKTESLSGLTVAIQGLGHVGWSLATQLAEAGAKLIVTDIRPENIERATRELGVRSVAPDEIYGATADVFAPCALGAVINDTTLPQLKCSIIAGAANNQLAEARHGDALKTKNILYTPDYALNAGGVINVGYEYINGPGKYDKAKALAHIAQIPGTLQQIFELAKAENIGTHTAADRLAELRLSDTPIRSGNQAA